MELLRRAEGLRSSDSEVMFGEGDTLDEASSARFPVPQGFVITSQSGPSAPDQAGVAAVEVGRRGIGWISADPRTVIGSGTDSPRGR